LVKFDGKTVGKSGMLLPPWAAQQKIEMILSVSRLQRWPRQVQQ